MCYGLMLIAEAQVSLNDESMQEVIMLNFELKLATCKIHKNFSLRYWYLRKIDLA